MGIFNRKLGLFLTLLQFFGYAACAALQRVMHGHKERKIPLITYCGLGFLQVMFKHAREGCLPNLYTGIRRSLNFWRLGLSFTHEKLLVFISGRIVR